MPAVKSVFVTAFGGYDVLEVRVYIIFEFPFKLILTYLQVKKYELEEMGDNDVAVDVYFCGVNFADLYTRLGLIPKDKLPFILGIECSGIIADIGKNVTKFKVCTLFYFSYCFRY